MKTLTPLRLCLIAHAFCCCLALLGSRASAQSLTQASSVVVTGSGNPNSIAAVGTIAYVGNYSTNTLQAYNMSNPATPVLLSTTPNRASLVRGMVATATKVYLTCFGLGYSPPTSLHVFDVSNPAAPVSGPVVQVQLTTGGPMVVGASNALVCAAGYSQTSLKVYDAALNLLNTIQVAGSIYSVAVKGTTAYVDQGGVGLIYDLSTPTAPVVYPSPSNSRIFLVSGNLGIGIGGIYDISAPLTPVQLSPRGFGAAMFWELVAVSGNTLFSTGFLQPIGNTSPLRAYDISRPTAPVLLATAGAGSTASALASGGDAAYLVNIDLNTLQTYTVTGRALAAVGSAVVPATTLAPNPAHLTTTISGSVLPGTSVVIYDPTGRICLQTKSSVTGVLDVHALPTGLYFVRIGATTCKLVVE
jgi:hypothetical protein